MVRRRPPLNPIRAFETAARHMSFTAAAEELGITQIAVSRQVRVLEDYLEVPLFERSHQSIRLTAEGARLFPATNRALDEINRRGFSVSSTLGRHTNDKMVSFYVRAPGGWDIEYGCEGMRVDEAHYTAEEITADSYWGHDWSGSEPLAAFVPPGK